MHPLTFLRRPPGASLHLLGGRSLLLLTLALFWGGTGSRLVSPLEAVNVVPATRRQPDRSVEFLIWALPDTAGGVRADTRRHAPTPTSRGRRACLLWRHLRANLDAAGRHADGWSAGLDYVLINIPAFELQVVAGNVVERRHRVIVG